MIALPSQMLALDGDVKVGRAETRGCSYPGGVGPWGETPSGALGVNLKATEKEPCSNACGWDRCQEQSSQRGQDRTKKRCSRRGHLGVKQNRPAGMLRAVAPRGGHILSALSGRTGRKVYLLLLVASLPSDNVEGKVRSPEKRAEMAHLGTGNWPFMRLAI